LGIGVRRFFNLPSWTAAVAAFNNTTSLPLLLVKTLYSTGTLNVLIISSTDSTKGVVNRASSFFLINSLCSSVISLTIGPRLLDGDGKSSDQGHGPGGGNANDSGNEEDDDNYSDDGADERTSLLPGPSMLEGGSISREAYNESKKQWGRIHPRARYLFEFAFAFFNAPMIGGIIGIIIGLVPQLHSAFFNNVHDGGVFKVWFTTSMENVGDLYAALQGLVVGVKLSGCLRKMKRGDHSGIVPKRGVASILFLQFVLWPV
jgi:auxin efflux carrier family protein